MTGQWVVIHTLRGSDILHSYPVTTVYGPLDEAAADDLREELQRPPEEDKETIVEAWMLTAPPTQ